MTEATTRQRIAAALRAEPHTASELSRAVGVPTSAVYEHVDHVAESLGGGDERLLVSPPVCRDCGFDGFDDPINAPSRCPECKNEGVAAPTFTIEDD
ncbi:MAG: transcriptional regulator [Halolamina sp.]